MTATGACADIQQHQVITSLVYLTTLCQLHWLFTFEL